MELPREDLLRYRRRGDYQGYAVALARTREDDDAYVKVATRDQRLKRDLVGLKKKVSEPDWIWRLEKYLREPGGDMDERHAEVCEVAHLRDLLKALDPVDAPALGDLPVGGGSLTSRCATAAAFDLVLLDGVAGWIGDDADLEEKPGDIKTEGKASALSENLVIRGFRLWQFRNLLMGDYGAKGGGKYGSEPPWAPLHQINSTTGDWYAWANKEMGREKILSRVAAMGDWSPMRQSFQTSKVLSGDNVKESLKRSKDPGVRQHWGGGIDDQSLVGPRARRPHDHWMREKLSEHWQILKREVLQRHAQKDTIKDIAACLHIHEKTIGALLASDSAEQRP